MAHEKLLRNNWKLDIRSVIKTGVEAPDLSYCSV